MTSALGIFQGDIIVRTALILGIKDLKKNPWLLDFVFASLVYDEATSQQYGQKEIDKAKKWFLETEIPVVSANRIDDPKFPCLSVAMLDSSESENTLADVHYDPVEVSTQALPPVANIVSVQSYNVNTGALTVKVDNFSFFSTAMSIVDKTGRIIPITDTGDDPTQQPDGKFLATLYVAAGTIADFRGAVIKQNVSFYNITLESANFKETYVIGCHVQGEPYKLLYLHSIVSFILLRYKERLFEGRGFERSSFSSSDLQQNPSFEDEVVLSRFITINGYVKQFWPKDLQQPISSLVARPKVSGAGNNPDIKNNPAWLGDEDNEDALAAIGKS